MYWLAAIFLLTISLISFVYGYFKYAFNYWKSRGVPCAEPSIPFGHMRGAGTKYHLSDIVKRLYDLYKPTGAKICGAYYYWRPVAIILDLEFVKNVLIKDFSNFNERNVYVNEIDDPIGVNLASLNGESWKKLRGKLSPAFSSGKMKFMFSTNVKVGEQFRDSLFKAVSNHSDGIELEMGDWCARFMTDVIGSCAFGIECNSLNDPNSEFRKFSRLVTGNPRHGTLFMNFMKSFKGFGKKLHMKTIRDDVSMFVIDLVRKVIEYRKENHEQRKDFMDILIKLNEKASSDEALTFNEIAAQTLLFFGGGFETSSFALTFCLYELALNQAVQDKARRVIQETFKKFYDELTYDMMMEMPYIDQVIDETLRKYAAAGTLTKETKNDYQIPGTDIVIEKGVSVMIPIRAIHHDPEYYPNPDQFDPDRFESEEKKKRNPMAWLPFGDGPRNCIGIRFAMMQMRIGVVYLLRNFHFSIGSRTIVPITIRKEAGSFAPGGDVYLKVKTVTNHYNRLSMEVIQ